jgi:hypothetical protein
MVSPPLLNPGSAPRRSGVVLLHPETSDPFEVFAF